MNEDNKKITDFNSFKVFENIYSEDRPSRAFASRYDELETPDTYAKKNHLGEFIMALIIVVIASFSLHPLLSYFLKTPYPLVVISEDSMRPIFSSGDAVLVRGVIDRGSIAAGDYVVFRQEDQGSQVFSARRVDQIRDLDLTVSSENGGDALVVMKSQVFGIVTGHNDPIKIPLLGKIINFRS